MKVILERGGIEYGLMDDSVLEGAIQCVSEVFVAREPMSVHLGITAEEFLVFARAYYPVVMAEELSFVARDAGTGEVVGVRISEDYFQEEIPDIEGLSPKFFPLFTLLETLGKRAYDLREIKPNKYVHLFMIAVKESYANRGIAPTMNKIFFTHVKNRGFTYALTEPTGEISQHILLNKFGFEKLDEIAYDDFEFDGGKPFQGLKGHRCAMLLEKELATLPDHLEDLKDADLDVLL